MLLEFLDKQNGFFFWVNNVDHEWLRSGGNCRLWGGSCLLMTNSCGKTTLNWLQLHPAARTCHLHHPTIIRLLIVTIKLDSKVNWLQLHQASYTEDEDWSTAKSSKFLRVIIQPGQISSKHPVHLPGMLTPPCTAEKRLSAPPRKKQVLPIPAPWSSQTRGAKLTADSIDGSFSHAFKLCIRGRNSRKIFSFDFVTQIVTILFTEISF